MAGASKSIKLPLSDYGFPALCAYIAAVRRMATTAGDGITQLSSAMNTSLQEIEAALNDFPSAANIVISTTGWVEDQNATHSYKYYYDIDATGTTSDDLAIVAVSPNSLATAATCGLCSTNQTLSGKVRLYSLSVPSSNLDVTLMVLPGLSSQQANQQE